MTYPTETDRELIIWDIKNCVDTQLDDALLWKYPQSQGEQRMQTALQSLHTLVKSLTEYDKVHPPSAQGLAVSPAMIELALQAILALFQAVHDILSARQSTESPAHPDIETMASKIEDFRRILQHGAKNAAA